MTAPGTLVAFVATTDIEATRAFYRDKLGLTVTSSSPHGDTYDGGGTELRVTPVREKAPAVYTVLGWQVTDLDAAVETLRVAGVVFNEYAEMEQDDHGACLAPDGTRVVWFSDPDGNTLSLHQHADA